MGIVEDARNLARNPRYFEDEGQKAEDEANALFRRFVAGEIDLQQYRAELACIEFKKDCIRLGP